MITENSHPLAVWTALKEAEERIKAELTSFESAAQRAHALYLENDREAITRRKQLHEIGLVIGGSA